MTPDPTMILIDAERLVAAAQRIVEDNDGYFDGVDALIEALAPSKEEA